MHVCVTNKKVTDFCASCFGKKKKKRKKIPRLSRIGLRFLRLNLRNP